MASSSEVAKRRVEVGELWLRGVPIPQIAHTFGVTEKTIRKDVLAVRALLERDRVDDLQANRDSTIASLIQVKQAAWDMYNRTAIGSTNKASALNTVCEVNSLIAKIQGTIGPNVQANTTVNVLASGEWQQAIATLLQALAPYSEARVAAADALMQIEEATSAHK